MIVDFAYSFSNPLLRTEIPVNQVCKTCYLHGCSEELKWWFKKVLIPVTLLTLLAVSTEFTMSLVFITQIAIKFSKKKSDYKQLKIGLRKLKTPKFHKISLAKSLRSLTE